MKEERRDTDSKSGKSIPAGSDDEGTSLTLNIITDKTYDSLPMASVPGDVSFSGRLSTFEAESFAEKLNSTVHDVQHRSEEIPQTDRELSVTSKRSERKLVDNGDAPISTPIHSDQIKRSENLNTSQSNMPTTKRSNITTEVIPSKRDVTTFASTTPAGIDNGATFSEIVSLFEARSSSLEPPPTKRLTGQPFPIVLAEESVSKTVQGSESSHSDKGSCRSPVPISDEARNETCSVVSNESLSIDDQSTLPPPPTPYQENWDDESWDPPTPIQILEDSSLFMMEPISPVIKMETSLQYSESTVEGISLQYSESTVDGTLGHLLFTSQEESLLEKRACHLGPIDLDESVTDSCSDTSSLYGSMSWTKNAKTPVKNKICHHESESQVDNLPSILSPLNNNDDDDHTPFEDEEDIAEEADEQSLRYNWSQFDEAVLSQTFQETMESISVSKRLNLNKSNEPGALLLTEEELNRHEEFSKFKQAFPSSSIQGYDIWKRKQEKKQRYFAKIHEKAMKQKQEREMQERHQPSKPVISHSFRNVNGLGHNVVDATSANTAISMMDISVDSTIQTAAPHQTIPKIRKERPRQETRRGWNLISGVLHKKNGTSEAKIENTRGKGSTSQKTKSKKKKEPAVVTLETFMRISSDEPEDVADMSLAPLNKLPPMTLPSSIPTGTTYAATSRHNLDPIEGGPRKLALEHLERERQKNVQAENDKTKLEIREQRRISMLKERELERQRQMNVDSIFSKNSMGTQCGILESTLSFGSTNTAKSSIKSPTSVIHLSPCIICDARERTHVSMPCMHFYFCESCASNMTKSQIPVACPICSTDNVSFKRVYT
jgi:hypothetical protein